MKKLFFIFPLMAVLGYVVLSSMSAGAGLSGVDGTGATTAAGCNCHTSATTTTVALELDSAGIAVTHYIAGHSYTIKLTGTNTSTSSLPRFGFQVAAINVTGAGTSSATNAGTLATTGLPTGTQNTSLGSVNVVEQTSALVATSGTGASGTTYVESIPWTAPATAGTGSIKLYGVVNAVNYNGSSGGDKYNKTNVTITELVLPSIASITGTTTVCAGSTTTLSDATAGGTWSSGSPGVATITSGGVVTGVMAGTSVITYTVGSGSVTTTVTVNPTPAAITGTPSVCAGSTVSLGETTTGGIWATSNAAVSTVTGGAVTGVAGGVDTIVYLLGTCYAYVPFTVNPLPVAGSISGPSSVCIGTPISLTDPAPGGTWSSGSPLVASVTGSGSVSGLAVGTAVISYSVSNSCGTAVATHTVTVGTSASAGTISGATSVCAGSTITLNDPVTGGTWSSGSPLTASVSSTGTVSGLASGTAVISYTVSGSCGVAVATSTITVNPLPVAGTISGPSGICLGTPITLTDASGGGSWTSSLPGVATVNASGVVNGVSTGTTVITYTVSNTCGTVFTTHPVTVSLPPSSGTISGPSVVCQGATITLSDGVAGGTWSSSAGGTAAVGSFNGVVSGVSSGTASISYTITGSCGSAASVYSVTVNPPPTVAAIAGGTTICQGTTVNLTDATPGGVWSTPTPGIASVSSTGLVTGLSGGAATVDYSVSGACGTTTVTYTVNVTGIPDPASIVGLMGTCVGNTFTLFDATPGGTWTSSSPSTAAVSSGGVVSGLALGTATITYTVANTCGTAFVVHPVTVNVPPTVGPISGTISSFCAGTTITLTDATSGGAWITGAPGVASVSSAGVVTGLTGGPATISYTVANTCASVSATYNVTIVPQPNAGSISGSAVLCTGSSSALTDAAAGGVFSSSQPAVATINASGIVTGLTTGTTVITYTVTNSCGSVYTIFPVAVSTPPVAGTIAGSTNVCVGATTTLTDTATGGTWSGSNAAVATVSAAGIVTGVAPGSIVVSYTVAGSCENLAATQTITVNPLPDAGVISGSSRVCIGTPSTLTETVSGGSWTSSSAPVASISAGGIVVGVTSGVVTISYTVTNSCGTAVATMTDTVVTASVCATGVEEMGANASFSVYPNPSNGVFNVELPVTAGKVTVLVTDLFGKVVATQQADGSNGKLQIQLTDLAAGNYVIKITSGNDIFRSKITIW